LIKAPVIALVEAKNDNIQAGLPQCMAEMVAAKIFNERRNNNLSQVYGVVTTGTNWKFLQQQDNVIEVDLNDYFINNLSQILGILKYMISDDLNFKR
jgi:hypothetical protein